MAVYSFYSGFNMEKGKKHSKAKKSKEKICKKKRSEKGSSLLPGIFHYRLFVFLFYFNHVPCQVLREEN